MRYLHILTIVLAGLTMLGVGHDAAAMPDTIVLLDDVNLTGSQEMATVKATLRGRYADVAWTCHLSGNSAGGETESIDFAPTETLVVGNAVVGNPRWDEALQPGEVVTLHLSCRDDSTKREGVNELMFFRWTGDRYDRVSFDDHLKEISDPTPDGRALVLRGHGHAKQDDRFGDLPPWQNPQLTPEQVKYIHTQIDASKDLGVVQSALTASAPTELEPDAETDQVGAGCANSGASGSYYVVALLLAFFFLIRRLRGAGTVALSLAAAVVFIGATGDSASATTRYAYGWVTFWDVGVISGGIPASNWPGARYAPCVSADTTCTVPDDGEDCCYRGIPSVRVELRDSSSNIVHSVLTDSSGLFILVEDDWHLQNYSIRVKYERAWEPSHLTTKTSGGATWSQHLATTQLSDSVTYFSNLPVNTAADPLGVEGELGSIWRSATQLSDHLDADGNDALKHTFNSSNDYDNIDIEYKVIAGPSTAECDSTVNLDVGWGHTTTAVHELGHVAQFRSQNCQSVFHPSWRNDPHSWTDNSEGNVIAEGLASFITVYALWDPASATTPNIYSVSGGCAFNPNSQNSRNMAAVDRNVGLAIWEFIDASTSNTHTGNTHPDSKELSVDDVLAGFTAWTADTASPGTNRSRDEKIETTTLNTCTHSDQCQTCSGCTHGDVCFDGFCFTGDPHGENVRDWVHHIGVVNGGSSTGYWKTLASSPCIGDADNSYAFTKGYRSD